MSPSDLVAHGYRRQTHRPINSAVLVAVLLGVFHFGSAFTATSLAAPHDLQRVLSLFGPAAWYVPPAAVLATLLILHALRDRRWRIDGWAIVGMLVESAVWTVPLFADSYLCQALGVLAAAETAVPSPLLPVLLATGAGVYEEFIFRLVILGGGAMLLLGFGLKKDRAALLMLIASSVLFSLYHFSWTSNEYPFALGPFIFRAGAGAVLGIVYLSRGLGVAVGTHTLWNLLYFTLR